MGFLCKTQSMKQLNLARQYIAQYILHSSEKTGYFKENLRRVADAVGVSYRHLHCIMGEFVEKGILEHSDRGFEIRDREALNLLINLDD